jgi:hypothetical protein
MGKKKEKHMLKTFAVVLAGMVTGAVAVEIVRQKYPNEMDKLRAKAHKIVSGVKEGFQEGYRATVKTGEPTRA